MTTKTIDELTGDIFDIRDVIERFEELETDLEGFEDKSGSEYDELSEEHAKLRDLLEDVRGCGGDEQWRGDWYPLTFIRNDYFTDYTEELLKDVGDLPSNIPWYIEIDWEATARNIQVDYSSVEFNGSTYWYR